MWNIVATMLLLLELVLGLASILSPTMGTLPSRQVSCYNMNHGSLVGESAVVRCPITSSETTKDGRQRDEQPSWFVSAPAGQTSRSVLLGDSRFIVAHGALWLQNTTMEDAGNYTCTRGNDTVCMRLLVWPRDGHICHSHNSHFHAKGICNQSVQLTCPFVDDLPMKNVLWYKECKQLSQPNNSTIFIIPHMQQENVGNYTCVVSTWVAGTKYKFSRTWNLSIRDRVIVKLPVMIYPQGNVTRAVVLGKPLRLICQARYTIAGLLKPLVWWLIDGNFSTDSHITGITEDNDSTIVNKTGGYETVEQGLNIIKVEQIHLSVNFTCIALNGRGFTSGSVSLYENNDTRKTDTEGSWKYRDQVKKTWIWEVVGTIATLITLFTLGYALRFDIILFYRHYLAQEPPPDGKRFDACIVTALDATQAELNFALQELPEALEKRLCYSLWINARNANSCQYMEGLRSALSLSRRLIVVLSPHCVIKSNMSHHGIDAILNTVLDKGNPPSLMIFICPLPRGTAHSLIKRPILQRAFKELPVLCWEEEKPMLCSSFWSRLHCFLPHQRASAQKQDWQQFGDEE